MYKSIFAWIIFCVSTICVFLLFVCLFVGLLSTSPFYLLLPLSFIVNLTKIASLQYFYQISAYLIHILYTLYLHIMSNHMRLPKYHDNYIFLMYNFLHDPTLINQLQQYPFQLILNININTKYIVATLTN